MILGPFGPVDFPEGMRLEEEIAKRISEVTCTRSPMLALLFFLHSSPTPWAILCLSLTPCSHRR